MAEIEGGAFDRVMMLTFAFDENKQQDGVKVSWEEMKPELDKLSTTELEILLGLVKGKR